MTTSAEATAPTILITGGAGFVGASFAIAFRERDPRQRVIAFDNLRRRGSELALPRLRRHGVEFVHGDVRNPEDLAGIGNFDLLIDCSAEPSALAGATGSPLPVLNINLLGTLNCAEAARACGARVLFLSTSRVYPIARLNGVPFVEEETRFCWTPEEEFPGVTQAGISEECPLDGPRSFYGTSKLASEMILQEYGHAYGLPVLINRCGVLAGPGQLGRVDQGVVTLWVAHHYFERPLRYIGFGGGGKQVRDVLHVQDLFDLVVEQLDRDDIWDGRVYNIGGGVEQSVSLLELTQLCRQATGKQVPIGAVPETHPFDVRIYTSDLTKVSRDLEWRPQQSPETIVTEIHEWIAADEATLEPILIPDA
ncbi:MAG: NAD-dependent epimerase/dehydratase family protein [Planctomycetota bacterium]|nr:MAG: NAD-dependent epimerase/dehydratase family protein [Planctomycetota bacterium]REK19954.1 MAG: NAD-dependent epimerase/dehydratase family protein [Planctomycetota bacterium]REK27521.1 MAG: NAD-dependent epimerase/dehydratase family protein [Planctomycetota bacterium]